jgi:hypothetical protein
MGWAGNVGRIEETRNPHKIVIGKPKGRRPLGRPSHIRENGIELDLNETEYEGVDWIHLAEDMVQWQALEDTVMKLEVP